MYKYEMHLHSKGCSLCSIASAKELITAAKGKGYSGVVFTNHFYRGNTCIDRKLPWKDFVAAFNEDYLSAKEFGKAVDMDVLFGIEEGIGQGKEVLIYGISPTLLSSTPEFKSMKLPELYNFVHKNGGFAVCAHPFRRRDYISEPDKEPELKYFDAIEVYNHCNSVTDNLKAAEFAKKTGIPVISGGDAHNVDVIGSSGLAFNKRINDSKQLVKELRRNSYKLIINGQIL
ncbi:MAG: PHP domain-containing protein [Clostridia bacterium]|nr:PHP domain-containing protein [Clostridia bacterium]